MVSAMKGATAVAGGSLVAVVVGKSPRLYSATKGKFPVDDPTVAYFTIDEGACFEWIHDHDTQLKRAAEDALEGKLTLFAVWPGKTRSDVFVIDKPDDFIMDKAWTTLPRRAPVRSARTRPAKKAAAAPPAAVLPTLVVRTRSEDPPDVEEDWMDAPAFRMMPSPSDEEDEWT
jgi:hypothetical protein